MRQSPDCPLMIFSNTLFFSIYCSASHNSAFAHHWSVVSPPVLSAVTFTIYCCQHLLPRASPSDPLSLCLVRSLPCNKQWVATDTGHVHTIKTMWLFHVPWGTGLQHVFVVVQHNSDLGVAILVNYHLVCLLVLVTHPLLCGSELCSGSGNCSIKPGFIPLFLGNFDEKVW